MVGFGRVGRKPVNDQAQTPAQRKQAQRVRDNSELAEKPVSEWSERLCLIALASPKFKSSGDEFARAAWMRLGELRGFLDKSVL